MVVTSFCSGVLQGEENNAYYDGLHEADDASLCARRRISLQGVSNFIFSFAHLEARLENVLIDSVHDGALLDHEPGHLLVQLGQIIHLSDYLGYFFISMCQIGVILHVLFSILHYLDLQLFDGEVWILVAVHLHHLIEVLFFN